VNRMNFKLSTAQVFVPDGLPEDQALARTTQLAISAHQDDIEIMATAGILECFQQPDKWFTGVVVTNGAGSPRAGVYGQYTDQEMQVVRVQEQKKAAVVGEYAAQVFLDYSSAAVKDGHDDDPVDDIEQILRAARPQIVYTHNLADKHPTHVGVTIKTLRALRRLPADLQPEQVYGCEVWRDLDWLLDEDKVAFDLSAAEGLQMALIGVFDSQVSGGKRYDLASQGRRRANATYFASHATDVATALSFAMDLTPLLRDPSLDPADYVQGFIDRLAQDVRGRIDSVS